MMIDDNPRPRNMINNYAEQAGPYEPRSVYCGYYAMVLVGLFSDKGRFCQVIRMDLA